jgi:HAD superfamily, subfamily IIIB (Acid phosphatase)
MTQDFPSPRPLSDAARRRRRAPRAVLAAATIVLVLAVGGVAFATSAGGPTVKYRASGGVEVGLRPTGVGLPDVGESSTLGAGELVSALAKYHDSGEYESDLTSVDQAAQEFLDAHASSGHGKPAIVLDIDETSLSNYTGMLASGFTAAGTVAQAASGTGTAIAPTLALYRDAIAHKVAVFFVTGRPSEIQVPTETNLRDVGYDEGWSALDFKPAEADTEQFKSSTRAAIKKAGYRIVVNVGDQQSDLDGGFAQRAFKLPNPFYFIPD